MDTKAQLTTLSEICRQDQKIIANLEKLQRINQEGLAAQEAALLLEDTINTLTVKKSDLLKRRRALDDKLMEEKGNLRKWESRSEKIKGEREYTALMSEIGSQKRTVSGIELELNDVTVKLKASDEELIKATVLHKEKAESVERAFSSVKEQRELAETEHQQNEKVRAILLEKLPKLLRTKYERIFEKRAHVAISYLKDAICQACMRKIPPELFNRMRKGEIIEQCPSCQRLLVADLENQK